VERSLTHHAAFGQDTTLAAARLIRRMSERVNPWRLDASSREAVGESFTAIYALWRDSVMRTVAPPTAAMPAEPTAGAPARMLMAPDWTVRFPRFLANGDLIAVIDDRRLTPGAVRVSPDGRVERVGRRNAVDAGAPTAEGTILRGELDFADPYSTQSDLYVGEGLGRRRLTRGARLAHPDVHQASGRIVAVRTAPGTTELVTLSMADPTVTPFAAGSLDRSWTEPRFSASGSHVAAALWERGGRTSIVVLDRRGDEIRRFAPRAADDSLSVLHTALV
jgi:hypothetical protein